MVTSDIHIDLQLNPAEFFLLEKRPLTAEHAIEFLQTVVSSYMADNPILQQAREKIRVLSKDDSTSLQAAVIAYEQALRSAESADESTRIGESIHMVILYLTIGEKRAALDALSDTTSIVGHPIDRNYRLLSQLKNLHYQIWKSRNEKLFK